MGEAVVVAGVVEERAHDGGRAVGPRLEEVREHRGVPHQGLVADHHAARLAGGARRVAEDADLLRARLRAVQRRRRGSGHVDVRGREDAAPAALRQPRQVRGIGDDGRGVEVVEDSIEVARGMPRVERRRHGAVGQGAEVGGDPDAAVVAQEGHQVAALDAEPLEARAKPSRGSRDLAVGVRRPAVRLGDEGRLGRALRPVEEELRQRVDHRASDVLRPGASEIAAILVTRRSEINQPTAAHGSRRQPAGTRPG